MRDQSATMRTVFGSEVRVGRISRDDIVALVLALLLVLLIVELWAAIGAALEHDMPASTIAEDLLRAHARSERRFFGGQKLRSDSPETELTLDQQLGDPVRQRAQLSPPPALSF